MSDAPYPWQRQQWSQLQAQIAQGRLPHALLLSGIPGLGKMAFALSLTQAILCEQPTGEGRACGVCRSCQLYVAGTHPDRLLVQPESPDKPIRIDAVRGLIEFLTFSPSLKSRRVVVVQPADALNVFAANSLLKTLEEPASAALLMLVTDRPTRLPATVRSRCQSLRFGAPAVAETRVWLNERLGEAGRATVALARANGAPLAALEYADEAGLKQRARLIEGLGQLVKGRADVGELADELADTISRTLLDTLAAWLRDLIRVGNGAGVRENPDFERELLACREGLDLARLFECLDQTQRLHGLLGNGLNAALQLEALLIRYRAAVKQ
ncbi:DNA polymerase III subunit delta' [Acidihalobacter yilgarnensis]|uniref:DNA polymerase III subunit delta' n=1 Tax=Acidihalobacter yilgarnensis TaxID=2819280 RepID=A0A1D8INP7_9GAMM|nr:DNA polymerase III subunit delta' [Acidihalobacter yilgarnensis]AOU98096.1 DNA polymerase III subunit delta' [Acidihalobacter yilgarnensis]